MLLSLTMCGLKGYLSWVRNKKNVSIARFLMSQDVVVKKYISISIACGIITLVGFVLLRQSLSTESYTTKIIQYTLLFIINTSSPASALLWLCSVNFSADRRLLIQNGYFLMRSGIRGWIWYFWHGGMMFHFVVVGRIEWHWVCISMRVRVVIVFCMAREWIVPDRWATDSGPTSEDKDDFHRHLPLAKLQQGSVSVFCLTFHRNSVQQTKSLNQI